LLTSDWNKKFGGTDWPHFVAFRRFYFDGYISGKFSLGLAVPDVRLEFMFLPYGTYRLTRKIFDEIVSNARHMLDMRFTVGKSCPQLHLAGPALQGLYCRATSGFGSPVANNHVCVGSPTIYVELVTADNVQFKRLGNEIIMDFGWGALFSRPLYLGQTRIVIWVMALNRSQVRNRGRNVRIGLLRAFSELNNLQELFYFIVRNRDRLPDQKDWAPQFQEYLWKRLTFLNGASKDPLYKQALELLQRGVGAGHISAVVEQLGTLGLRPQLTKQAQQALTLIYSPHIEELNVAKEGDKITADRGSVAIGRRGKVTGGVRAKANIQEANINITELAMDLAAVRQLAEQRASTPAEKMDAVILKEAEKEALSGSKENALGLLKKCGKWVFDLAKEVGAKLLANLIEDSLATYLVARPSPFRVILSFGSYLCSRSALCGLRTQPVQSAPALTSSQRLPRQE
jgi:hypothetical protein